MKLSVDELREMIRNEINQQVLQEGPYLDRVKARADAFRQRGDDIVRAAKAITQTSDSSTPSTPSTPAPTTQPTPSTLPTPSVVSTDDPDPVDPEDMIEPTQAPVPSEDSAFDVLFDSYGRDENVLGDMTQLIASLLPLAGIRNIQDEKFMEMGQDLLQYYFQKNNITIDGNNTLQGEDKKVQTIFDDLGWALPQAVLDRYFVNRSEWSDVLNSLQRGINRVDSKTGFSQGLYSSLLNFEGETRLDDLQNIKKAYPAILNLTNKIGGSRAAEKLKDIMINLGYMYPEDVGRDDGGMIKSFYDNVIRGKRVKARDEMLRGAGLQA